MSDSQILAKRDPGALSVRYAHRLNRFTSRVTHRCARSNEDLDLVFNTRYTAYRRQNIISEREDKWLFDSEFDSNDNSVVTMSYIDGEFVSTFRIHVAQSLSDQLPSRSVFGDLIDPYLAAGLTVVDPTRLAARLEASIAFPELPFIALRPAWLAAEQFDANIVIATVAAEHAAFYQRVFGYRTLCEPRDYPKVRFKIVCMALNFAEAKYAVETRYPIFRSARAEREALFQGCKVSPAPPFEMGASNRLVAET